MAKGDWDDTEGNEFNADIPGEPFEFDLGRLLGGSEGLPLDRDAPDESGAPRDLHEKEVRVVGVYEQRIQDQPAAYFVLVRDNRDRNLRIYIGQNEAYSISMAVEEREIKRPLTHDLAKLIIERLGWSLDRIIVDDEYNGIFYAKMSLVKKDDGDGLDIDCRPSDAIAIALRTKSPIYVAEDVLQSEGRHEQEL